MAYIGKSPTGTGVRSRYYYTATGGETSLSGADDNSNTLVFSDGNYVDVSLNGVSLVAGTDYNTSTANTIGGLAALSASDIVEIVVYDIFTVADTVSAKNGGTFSGNVAMNGDLTVDTNTLYVDSTNNRVGVGTTSPTESLTVGAADNEGTLRIGDNGTYYGEIKRINASDELRIGHYGGSQNLTFHTVNAERLRIDSSGNLLVGTTDTSTLAQGVRIRADADAIAAVADGGVSGFFGRLNSDGEIVRFRKDGGTVGSIGSRVLGEAYIGLGSAGLTGSATGGGALLPTTGGTTYVDNVVDLGFSSGRFDDIYATNGTIQTSDANEKQQIAALTDAEITAAKAISQLFKTFKWNSAVTEKGDAARTHAGVIAQDVQAAMTAAGLDAGDYAFFISSTWWETQTEVPAVEADEENGVEAQEAYTRTDTYDTAEEAPEGAVERTRLGIRYPELLAFVGAATEQRLANIETRLAALENA